MSLWDQRLRAMKPTWLPKRFHSSGVKSGHLVHCHLPVLCPSLLFPLLDSAERNTPSPIDPDAIEVDINFQPDPTDLVLSSVPGGELFNPRKHRFSQEELKPQPMIKKAKKVFVPDEQKVSGIKFSSSQTAVEISSLQSEKI